jgi:dynein heavy chain
MKWEDTLAASIEDMKADFMMAVKKAIVDFVLQDPAFVRIVAEKESPFKKELKDLVLTVKPAFNAAKLKLEKNLHVINPCLAAILDIWYNRFRYTRPR